MKKILTGLIFLSSMASFASSEKYKCISSTSSFYCAEVESVEGAFVGGRDVVELVCSQDITFKSESGRMYMRSLILTTHIDEKVSKTASNIQTAFGTIKLELESEYKEISSRIKKCE